MRAARQRHAVVQAGVTVAHQHQGQRSAGARQPRILAATEHSAQRITTTPGAELELARVAAANDCAARIGRPREAVLAFIRCVLLAARWQRQAGLLRGTPRVHVMLLMRQLLLHSCIVGCLEPRCIRGCRLFCLILRPRARLRVLQ